MSDSWFHERVWSISPNKEGKLANRKACDAAIVITPRTAEEISQALKQNQDVAVGVVCGGHSTSNVSTWPFFGASGDDGDGDSRKTIIVDMKHMSSVSVNKETNEVTVGGGTIFRQLAEKCAEESGALPIGTGPTVGVCGYALNGGISGYFGKRLGMLGQRATRMDVVLANGDVRTLALDSDGEDADLFRACLGAGSALGAVASMTFEMENESCFQTGGSIVVPCSDKATAKPFLAKALAFMQDNVLPVDSVAMEMVITADFTVICSFMFYDTFAGKPGEFVQQLRDDAKDCNVTIVSDGVTSHKSWFDAASSLWEVIDGIKGSPVVHADHCIGTQGAPSEDVIDFILDKWVGTFLQKAPLSMIEIRSLGGAASRENRLPTGNAKCTFFVNMIVCYDGSSVGAEDKAEISNEIHGIIKEAMDQGELKVDFSGTHNQSDDPKELLSRGDVMFGSAENRDFVCDVKRKFDPSNRFCFHPFSHLM